MDVFWLDVGIQYSLEYYMIIVLIDLPYVNVGFELEEVTWNMCFYQKILKSDVDPQLFQELIFSVMWLIVAFTDRYEVLFFDGFTKNIKGIRMSKLEDEADKVDEVRLNYVLCFSVFIFTRLSKWDVWRYFLIKTCIGINRMLLLLLMMMFYNYQTPSEYHHLSCFFCILLYRWNDLTYS